MAGYKGFKFGEASYTPDAVWFEKHALKEYRAEYSRLYRVAQRRLKSFETAGRTSHQEYRFAKQYLVSPKNIKSARDLGYALSDVHHFLSSSTGTLRGLKRFEKRTAKSLQEYWGFTSITPDKVSSFGDFMDYMRAQGFENQYGSGRVAELFAEAVARNIDPMRIAQIEEDFNYFIHNLDAFSDTPRHRKSEFQTLDTYRKDIEKIKRKRSRGQ